MFITLARKVILRLYKVETKKINKKRTVKATVVHFEKLLYKYSRKVKV